MLKRKLLLSNRAHLRLNKRWQKEGNSDKARAYSNYHAECYEIQSKSGKLLSKTEKKKLFRWWWDSEHK